MYTIVDSGNDTICKDTAALSNALMDKYLNKHVSVKWQRQSGIKTVVFITVTPDGPIDTYTHKPVSLYELN
ncbi:hypothetical protein [Shewanella algae]|uniref:hypothetical protein n=1 Tax=Shewanella algae TaxID=38313 RepID=UPI0031F56223